MNATHAGSGNNSSAQGGSGTSGTGQGGSGHQDEAASSVGGRTSGQAGAAETRETQRETGGSGGSGLTANQSGESDGAPQQRASAAGPAPKGEDAAPSHSAVQSGARGAQDTRSEQGGSTGFGLGTPETGANQTPGDMEHKK